MARLGRAGRAFKIDPPVPVIKTRYEAALLRRGASGVDGANRLVAPEAVNVDARRIRAPDKERNGAVSAGDTVRNHTGFFVGPVLFTLLQASLRHGFSAGAIVAAGIAASDVCCIGLCALGVGRVLGRPGGAAALGVAGGLIMMGFGLAGIVKATAPLKTSTVQETGRTLKLF